MTTKFTTMKVIISLFALLYSAAVWGNDGDVFTAKTVEGIELEFKVISEAHKTCQVGTDEDTGEWISEETITIPASVNGYTVIRVATNAFMSYASTIEIPSSVTDIADYAFINHQYLKHVILHEGLESIGTGAFSFCNEMMSLEIPSTVTTIGEGAFINAKQIASVILKGEEPIEISKNVFNDIVYQTATLYVPSVAIGKYEDAAVWNEFLSIKEGVPGDFNPSYVATQALTGESIYLAYGTSDFSFRLSNRGTEPISSVSFFASVDGVDEEEQTYTLPEPVPAAYDEANYDTFEVPAKLIRSYPTGKYNMTYTITRVNSVEVNYGADYTNRGYGKMIVFHPVEKHNILIDESTSTSCVWSLRGNLGIRALEELYGSRIVHMAVHISDPMWCEPMSYRPFTPICGINNSWDYFDPYYGSSEMKPFGIKDVVEKYLNEPSPGSVRILKAAWANAERTKINVVMETTFGVDDTNAPFVIRFNLLEDKMKGDEAEWNQKNIYAGMTLDDPNLQPLTLLPEEVSNMEYDHVAVQYDWICNLKPGESPYRADSPQQVSYTIELSENGIIQDKDNLSVVAFLYDNSADFYAGKVFDADKSEIGAYEETGVSSLFQQPNSTDVYDIHGFKVSTETSSFRNLPHGIYIVDGKKVVK